MRIEALLFDLGRVLIDLDTARVGARWAELQGLPRDHFDERLVARIGASETYRRHERGEASDAEFFAHLRQELGLRLSDEQMLDGWNAMFIGEMPGVREVIAGLRGRLPLFVFSNTNPAHQSHWSVRFADLLAPFERIYVSNELGLRKPDPAAFRAVCADMGRLPERILFLDDSAENVAGAEVAGLIAVQVRSAGDIERALAGLA